MKKLKIAAVQMCSTEDQPDNLRRALSLLEDAVATGAQLIALPENFSYVRRPSQAIGIVEHPESSASLVFLQDFARQHEVAVVGGTIAMPAGQSGKVTNSCLVIDPTGKIAARYDKIHLFDVNLGPDLQLQESRDVEAGREIVTTELFGHLMGLSICYDLRFPELYRTMAMRGAEVFFIPSAFTEPTGRDHWLPLLRARAIENLSYVVAPAQFGRHNPERISYGRTMIIGPWGQILAQSEDRESVVVCEVDFAAQQELRKKLPCLDHIRGDLFRFAGGTQTATAASQDES